MSNGRFYEWIERGDAADPKSIIQNYQKDIKDGSKLFMDYILEDKFQRAMAEKNYMLPVTDIKLGEEYNRVPTSAKVVTAL